MEKNRSDEISGTVSRKILGQKIRELDALNTLSRKVRSGLSLDRVIQSAVDWVVEVVHPDLVLFFLRDKNRLILRKSVLGCRMPSCIKSLKIMF